MRISTTASKTIVAEHEENTRQPIRHLRRRWPPTGCGGLKLVRLTMGALVVCVVSLQLMPNGIQQASCQLPDDLQRELNQNLAEQARLQALQRQQQQKQQHQNQLLQSRAGKQPVGLNAGSRQQQQQAHDPNNYSYQQVSPPIQYSYYQPYGDAAPATNQPGSGGGGGGGALNNPRQSSGSSSSPSSASQQAAPINIDLNNLNFDLPQPEAQVTAPKQQQQQHFTPSFTGVGGLPVLQPTANSANQADSYAPPGAPPLAPQARVQQGPPLTEADFRDITGGENYGAPGGNDFGLGDATSIRGQGRNKQNNNIVDMNNNRADETDAQLREFGMPADITGDSQPARRNNQQAATAGGGGGGMNIPDFGAFNTLGGGGGGRQQPARQRADNNDFGNFADTFGGPSGGPAQQPAQSVGGGNGGDFDFASQPSSNQEGGGGGENAGADGDGGDAGLNGGGQVGVPSPDSASGGTLAGSGGAPGSLQNLLGSGFPGLSGANGLDDFARGSTDPQQASVGAGRGQQRARNDDGALDIADLGDKSDQFSGADLGGFEQPTPGNDQDFNYGSASNQQPKSVPYLDANPQPMGTLLALTQPQTIGQARYNALPDKGTYLDYPAYGSAASGGSVSEVVDSTPSAREPGMGRYSMPSPEDLAPEYKGNVARGATFDYGRAPVSAGAASEELGYENFD